MSQNSAGSLPIIVYFAFIVFALILFLYLRQRNAEKKRREVPLYTSVHVSTIRRPPSFVSGSNLPTFSAQDAAQRKMPREIDYRDVNRKNLSYVSEFNTSVPSYATTSRARDQPNNTTERIFGDNRKYQPYEPSKLAPEPSSQSPKARKPEQTIEGFRTVTEFVTPSSNIRDFANPIVTRTIQTTQIITAEPITAINGQENKGNVDIKDGGFPESPVRFNPQDQSGMSLDSPIKMLGKESPVAPTNSKKKQEKQEKQEEQKPKSVQTKLEEKNERKNRKNQVYLDNDSDDEMFVEDLIDPYSKNKRTGKDLQGLEEQERETKNKKFLNNNLETKARQNTSKNALEESSEAERLDKTLLTGSKQLSKRSMVDISYMSEHGRNSSMRKYMEKKSMRDDPNKSGNILSPLLKQAPGGNKSTDTFFAKSHEKTPQQKQSLFTAQNPPGSQQKAHNNFLFTTQPKSIPEVVSQQSNLSTPAPQSEKASEVAPKKETNTLLGKKDDTEQSQAKPAQSGSLFSQPKTDTSPFKPGIFSSLSAPSNPISSIFSKNQKIVEETPTSDNADEAEKDKRMEAEPEKEDKPSPSTNSKPVETSPPKVEEAKPSLFSNITKQETGLSFLQKKEEEPKQASPPTTKGPSLFSNVTETKKTDTEPPKEQEKKEEKSTLFGSTGSGLFSNVGNKTPSGPGLNLGKTEEKAPLAENKTVAPTPSLFNLNPVPQSSSSGSIFSSNFNKPKEEVADLGMKRSSSLVAPAFGAKTELSPDKKEEEGSKGGFMNQLLSEKKDLSSLFGGQKGDAEKKDTTNPPSLGLFTSSGGLFRNTSTEQKPLGFPQRSDSAGEKTQSPEGNGVKSSGGLFGQNTGQSTVGFSNTPGGLFGKRTDSSSADPSGGLPNPTGSLFRQRSDTSSKKAEDPLGSYTQNPLGSPKRGDNPLAAFTQNPTGGLFGQRAESPKKGEKAVIGSVQNPTGNLFGQKGDSSNKGNLLGNLNKPSEGNKSIFGSGGLFGNNTSGSTAAGANSIWKSNEKAPTSGLLFGNPSNNNANNSESKQ